MIIHRSRQNFATVFISMQYIRNGGISQEQIFLELVCAFDALIKMFQKAERKALVAVWRIFM